MRYLILADNGMVVFSDGSTPGNALTKALCEINNVPHSNTSDLVIFKDETIEKSSRWRVQYPSGFGFTITEMVGK